jgi:hypothetical protein
VPAQGATKDFRQTVAERIERDPEFREALVVERAEAEPQAGAQQECPGCQFVNRNHLYSCPARHRVKPQAGAQVDFTLEEAFHAGFQACKELAEGVVDEHDGYLNRVSDLDASSAWMGWSGEGVDYGKH